MKLNYDKLLIYHLPLSEIPTERGHPLATGPATEGVLGFG